MFQLIFKETDLVVHVCQTDSSNTICRGSYLSYTMRCRLDRRLNVTTVEGVNVTVKESFVFEKKAKTNITASMMFYTSDLFDTVAASPLLVSWQINSASTKYISDRLQQLGWTEATAYLRNLHDVKGSYYILLVLHLYYSGWCIPIQSWRFVSWMGRDDAYVEFEIIRFLHPQNKGSMKLIFA